MNIYVDTGIISKRIRRELIRVREYSKVPKKEIANALMISTQQLAKYETGESNLKVLTLILFCQFFKIDIADFLKRCTRFGDIEHLHKTGQLNQKTVDTINTPCEDYTEYKI